MLNAETTTKSASRKSGFTTAFSSTLGTALEFYDFALYGLAAATVFKHIFFQGQSEAVALIASLATFAVGYFARPLGGVILGAIGDRLGRKQIMVFTVMLMGVASTLIGCLPTYQSVGIWAPAMLVLLRILQGIGAGAELASASTLLVESTPRARRGLVGSLVGIGTNGGTLLASVAWFLVTLLPHEALISWGWRIPFLASIVIAFVGLWMRMDLKESDTFTTAKEQNEDLGLLGTYGTLVKRSTGKMLAAIGMRWAENGISTIFLVFFVGQAVTFSGGNESIGSLAVILSAVVGLFTVPLFGWLSDKYGRRPIYLGLSIWQLAVCIPSIWMMTTGKSSWIVLAFICGYSIGVMGMYAVQSAFMAELFGSRSRLFAVTFSKEFGALSSGGVAPVICAALIGMTGNIYIIGIYMVLLGLVSIVSTLFLPETAGRDLITEDDAIKNDPTVLVK